MNKIQNKQIAMSACIKSIIFNIILTVFKLIAGIFSNSYAMLSDSVESVSDIFGTVIVMIGINESSKKSDHSHPYGHERFECVAAIILAMILFITGIGIGFNGIQKVILGMKEELKYPGIFALIMAIITIITKEIMYRYTLSVSKKVNSDALKADAWHHRSDAFSSIGSLVGIAGARLGLQILDPLACIVTCFCIIKTSISIFIDAINKMTDSACDDETINLISEMVLSNKKVHSLDSIKTRLFGSRIYVDIELGIDANLPLEEAHEIAHTVHDQVEKKFTQVKHCMIHVNPASPFS